MAITAETRQDIIELVVAAYNAAPGTTLLTELVAIIEDGGTLADVATALTTGPDWTGRYPTFQTAEEFAAEWLGNLVPEASEAALEEGTAVVVGLLNGGASFADIITEGASFLSSADEADVDFGTSAANFNNKVEVATYHTVTLENEGVSESALDDVTSDDATVTSANSELDGTAAVGQTIVLTTDVDNAEGGAGNDTFVAVVNADENSQTINLGDTIDGGDGMDTLKFTTDGDDAPLNVADISNIEHVQLIDVNDDLDDINLGGVVYDTATFVDLGDGSVDIDDITTATDVIFDDLDSNVNINYTDGSGTDSINLTFNGAEDANNGNVITIDDIETVNIVANEGDAFDDVLIDLSATGDDLDNLNVTANTDVEFLSTIDLETNGTITAMGSGDVDLNTLENANEQIVNASDLTGDLTVTGGDSTASITGGAGDDSVTAGAIETNVDLGAGDDVFDTNGLDWGGATAVDIEGGDGSDTIIIDDGTHLDAGTAAHIDNFEVLDVGGGTGTYDLDVYSFEGVDLSVDTAGDVTVDNITDEALTITGDHTNEVTYTLDSDSGSSTELNIEIAGSSSFGTDGISAGDITNTQAVEIINIASNQTITVVDTGGDAVVNDITMLDTNAETINITGNERLTITEFEDAGAENGTIETIDASDSAGLTMVNGVITASVSIIGSEFGDTLVVADTDGAQDDDGDGAGSTINAGAGGDVITYTDAGGVDTLIFEAGDSMVGFIDDDDSETYTAAGDRETFDNITGFTSGEDTLDLGSFGFTGQKASALAGATVSAAAAEALVDGSTSSIADLFEDTGVVRGVAVTTGADYSAIGGSGANDVLVFIDSNGDGDFTVADDDMLLLSGATSVALADFGF